MPSRVSKSAAAAAKDEPSLEEQVAAKRKEIIEELGADGLIGSEAAMKLSSVSNKPTTTSSHSPSASLLPRSRTSSSTKINPRQESLIENMLYPSHSAVVAREEEKLRRLKKYQAARAEKEIKEMQEKMKMQYSLKRQEIELEYKMRTMQILHQEMIQREEAFTKEVERWRAEGGGSLFTSGGIRGELGQSRSGLVGLDPINRGGLLVLTTQNAPGYKVTSTLGTVTGSHVTTIGDEDLSDEEAQSLPGEARWQAYQRLLEDARSLGANCIVSFTWHTHVIGEHISELLCIGTALRVESERPLAVRCTSCGHTHTQGKGGSNNHNQGGGKGGKNKMKRPPDCEHDDEDECDCLPVEDQKKPNNNVGGGMKKGGKGSGGPQLTPMESLVRMLMEMKLKEERENQAKSQRDALGAVLENFFASQKDKQKTIGAGFEWLDKLMAERQGETAKTGSQSNNTTAGWHSFGRDDQQGKQKGNACGKQNQRPQSPEPYVAPSGWDMAPSDEQQTTSKGVWGV